MISSSHYCYFTREAHVTMSFNFVTEKMPGFCKENENVIIGLIDTGCVQLWNCETSSLYTLGTPVIFYVRRRQDMGKYAICLTCEHSIEYRPLAITQWATHPPPQVLSPTPLCPSPPPSSFSHTNSLSLYTYFVVSPRPVHSGHYLSVLGGRFISQFPPVSLADDCLICVDGGVRCKWQWCSEQSSLTLMSGGQWWLAAVVCLEVVVWFIYLHPLLLLPTPQAFIHTKKQGPPHPQNNHHDGGASFMSRLGQHLK